MINVNIHPNTADATAKARTQCSFCWIEFKVGEATISFFGKPDQLDALRMIADIFNDAFARKAEPCTPAR